MIDCKAKVRQKNQEAGKVSFLSLSICPIQIGDFLHRWFDPHPTPDFPSHTFGCAEHLLHVAHCHTNCPSLLSRSPNPFLLLYTMAFDQSQPTIAAYAELPSTMSVDLQQSMVTQGYSREPSLAEKREFVSGYCREYFGLDPGRSELGTNCRLHGKAITCLDTERDRIDMETLERLWYTLYSRLAYRDHARKLLDVMHVTPFLPFAEYADHPRTKRIYERSYTPQVPPERMARLHELCEQANLGFGSVSSEHWTKPLSWIEASFWAAGMDDEEVWRRLGVAVDYLATEPQLPVIQHSLDYDTKCLPRLLEKRRP